MGSPQATLRISGILTGSRIRGRSGTWPTETLTHTWMFTAFPLTVTKGYMKQLAGPVLKLIQDLL